MASAGCSGAAEKKAGAAVSTAAAGNKDGAVAEKRDAADATPAAAAESGDTGGGGGVRLSQSWVNCILGIKPGVVEDPDAYYARMTSDPATVKLFSQEHIERKTKMLRDIAATSARIYADFEKFQAWTSAEFEEKGYVEVDVDDEFIARRVVLAQEEEALEKEYPEAFGPMEGFTVSDS